MAALASKIFKTKNETICLPTYMLVSQILFRLLLLASFTVSIALAYAYVAEDKPACLFNREAFNTSFECLNDYERDGIVTFSSYKMIIMMTGLFSALLAAPLCHLISNNIFNSMVQYLSQFEEQKQKMIADGLYKEKLEAASLAVNDPILVTGGSNSNLEPSQIPSFRLSSQFGQQRKNESVSSFRALLGAESFS